MPCSLPVQNGIGFAFYGKFQQTLQWLRTYFLVQNLFWIDVFILKIDCEEIRAREKKRKLRLKIFEFSRAFLISDFCKFWGLFAAQFTFSEMFLIAFDKMSLTLEYFFDYFEPFSQNEAVVLLRETIDSFSVFPNATGSPLSSSKIKARKFKWFLPKHSLISVSAEILLHH